MKKYVNLIDDYGFELIKGEANSNEIQLKQMAIKSQPKDFILQSFFNWKSIFLD